jgi:hypothetical protein
MALATALNELSIQCTGENVPEQVRRVLPAWDTEYPAMARSGLEQMKTACAGLEDAEKLARFEGRSDDVAGYSFARGAVAAAIDLHKTFGAASPPPLLEQRGSSDEVVAHLQAEAPPVVLAHFPNFGAELLAASRRPAAELRAAAARLEAAHTNIARRSLTDVAFPSADGPAPNEGEARALEFSVRAMNALVQVVSEAAVADAVALDAHLSRQRASTAAARDEETAGAHQGAAHRPAATNAKAARTQRGPAFFFRALQRAPAPSDPFNPCCEAVKSAPRPLGQQLSAAAAALTKRPSSAGNLARGDGALYVPSRASAEEALPLNGKLCGLPLNGRWSELDDVEMEPPAPRLDALTTDGTGNTGMDTSSWN